MKQLLSKDLMYEPTKLICEKFPEWLVNNKYVPRTLLMFWLALVSLHFVMTWIIFIEIMSPLVLRFLSWLDHTELLNLFLPFNSYTWLLTACFWLNISFPCIYTMFIGKIYHQQSMIITERCTKPFRDSCPPTRQSLITAPGQPHDIFPLLPTFNRFPFL